MCSPLRQVCDRSSAGFLWPVILGIVIFIGACGHATDTVSDASPGLVRLDAHGLAMPADSAGTDHLCVLDSRAGLIWEVKRTESGLHDRSNTFTWFSSESRVHKNDPGVRDGGECGLGRCDTEAFVEAVNSAGLCGHSDWRLPTREELMSLGAPAPDGRGRVVDRQFFPHAAEGEFWSASTFQMYPSGAWAVDARHGLDRVDAKAAAKPVRLVRLVQATGEHAR